MGSRGSFWQSPITLIVAVVVMGLAGGLISGVLRVSPSQVDGGIPVVSGLPSSAKEPATAPPSASLPASQKGVSARAGPSVSAELAASGASWYYNWTASPNGNAATPGVTFVPMIWGPSDVSPTVLGKVKQEGKFLLGFNEPDEATESDMTVQQAIDLWPQLEATGMELGSPAVSYGTNTTTRWIGQFMQETQARGYRVDFMTVHWYGQHNWDDVTANVNELKSYLEQTYALWGKPIWITELSLINFQDGPYPVYPTEEQQAAFLTAATKMLATLPFVQRYAWYALTPAGAKKDTTGLFTSTAEVTAVGKAYEEAP